ncbi:MAG TPA: hypothetical protein VGP07_24905 [Polyangia bacterium]|jgi:hypothetical protein
MPDSSQTGGENPPASAEPTIPAAAPPAPLPVPRPRAVKWLVVGIAAIVAGSLWSWRGKVGGAKPVDAPITLVTSDREDLACALDRAIGKYKCEFSAPGQRWSDAPAAKDRLAPYFTVDRQLYLVPGLFEQPALAARYQSESPQGRPRDKLRRFVARCKLRLVEKVDGLKTRWLVGGNFGPSDGAWVAEPEDCKVTNE